MQIFILDENIEKNAQYYVDKHVNKILTEICQIMCTVYRQTTNEKEIPDLIYKETHKNHPSVKWCKESYANFLYCIWLAEGLYDEYQYRYNKPDKHIRNKQIIKYFMACKINLNLQKGRTPFAQAMPDKYKSNNAVKSYRDYYINEKSHLFKWTKRDIPQWIKGKKQD